LDCYERPENLYLVTYTFTFKVELAVIDWVRIIPKTKGIY